MPHQSFLYRNLQHTCQTLSWPPLYTEVLATVIRVFFLVRSSPPSPLLDRWSRHSFHSPVFSSSLLCAVLFLLLFCSYLLFRHLQVSLADPHGHGNHHHHVPTTGNTLEKRQGNQGQYTVRNCLRFQACFWYRLICFVVPRLRLCRASYLHSSSQQQNLFHGQEVRSWQYDWSLRVRSKLGEPRPVAECMEE